MKTNNMAVYPASAYRTPAYRPLTKAIGRVVRWFWSLM